jgi:hypothetical protein
MKKKLPSKLEDWQKKGFILVPKKLVFEGTANDLKVFLIIKAHHNRIKRLCYPSLKTVYRESNLDKRTVLNSRNRLKSLNYLSWDVIKKEKTITKCFYRFPMRFSIPTGLEVGALDTPTLNKHEVGALNTPEVGALDTPRVGALNTPGTIRRNKKNLIRADGVGSKAAFSKEVKMQKEAIQCLEKNKECIPNDSELCSYCKGKIWALYEKT